mmetsp:Transcript_13308/g.31749  ORF Transcript_13308/g.31749 Transcript_13308/m.31749 type:complete len:205 (-) Transcript_13308:518-1132(-)
MLAVVFSSPRTMQASEWWSFPQNTPSNWCFWSFSYSPVSTPFNLRALLSIPLSNLPSLFSTVGGNWRSGMCRNASLSASFSTCLPGAVAFSVLVQSKWSSMYLSKAATTAGSTSSFKPSLLAGLSPCESNMAMSMVPLTMLSTWLNDFCPTLKQYLGYAAYISISLHRSQYSSFTSFSWLPGTKVQRTPYFSTYEMSCVQHSIS